MAAPDPTLWPELSKIDPQFEKIFQQMPPMPSMADTPGLKEAQAGMIGMWEQMTKQFPPDYTGVSKERISIPVRDGTSIPSVLYKPTQPPASGSPLVVLYHGGGWVMGLPEAEEATAIMLVRKFGAVALSVDYRMAPTGPFPIPIHDSFDALKWSAANASKLGADPSKGFLVGGSSAGANISAVVALLARDEKMSPPVTGAWLYIPVLINDPVMPKRYRKDHTSYEQNGTAPILGKREMAWLLSHYKPDPASPLLSPLLWPSGLDNLPPHFIQVAGLDPLRDDGLLYERVLRTESGVKTRLNVYPGVSHGFAEFMPMLDATKKCLQDRVDGFGWLLKK